MDNVKEKVSIYLLQKAEKINKVFQLLSSYNPSLGESMTYDKVMVNLIYDYISIDIITSNFPLSVIDEFILTTVDIILAKAEELTEENIHKLRWHEIKLPMQEAVYIKFPEIKKVVDAEVAQRHLRDELKRDVSFIKEKFMRYITSLLSSEGESAEIKTNVESTFKMLQDNVAIAGYSAGEKKKLLKFKDSKETRDARKIRFNLQAHLHTVLTVDYQNEVLEEIEKFKKECLDFLELKIKEEPTKILYFKTSSGVAVKAKLKTNSYRYTKGRGKQVRHNQNKDCSDYPLIISIDYIEDFLYQNDVRDVDIFVDQNSVDVIYKFNNKISTTLTPAFIKAWGNYDCPTLYRITPNKYRHETILGQPICHFTNSLIESSWSDVHVDDDITKEEGNCIINAFGNDSCISKAISSMLIANDIKAEKEKAQEKIEGIRKSVTDFEEKVQNAIDNNVEEILDFLKVSFTDRVVEQKSTGTGGINNYDFRIEDDFGFDCGDFNIHTIDKDYKESHMLLSNLDSSITSGMNVQLPYESQSLTLMSKEFEKVKEVVKRETGIELYHTSKLD